MATGRRTGRPAKPVEAKRATGNPGKRKLGAAPAPTTALANVPADVPAVPARLGEVGRAAWVTIWSGGRRWLSEAQDAPLVARVCRKLEQVDAAERALGDDPAGWVYSWGEGGRLAKHPLWEVIEKADAQVTAWLSLLGFSPSDRARLGLAEIRVANELDAYRARKAGRTGEGVGSGVVDAAAEPVDGRA